MRIGQGIERQEREREKRQNQFVKKLQCKREREGVRVKILWKCLPKKELATNRLQARPHHSHL